ncbi:25146_t:CDS:2, partial [Gigaspora margarita]
IKNICQTLVLDYNSKFHLFKDLSILTKCYKVLKIAHQVLNIVEEEKENIFYSNDNIKIKHIQFEIGDKQFDIYFGSLIKKHKILYEDAISDKTKNKFGIKKQISLLLVDILQPIVFKENKAILDIADKNIVTNMLESIGKEE